MQHQVTSMQHQSSDAGLQSFHQMWRESCGWHVKSLTHREHKLYTMLEGYHIDNVSLTAEVDKLNGDFSDMLKGYNTYMRKKASSSLSAISLDIRFASSVKEQKPVMLVCRSSHKSVSEAHKQAPTKLIPARKARNHQK